MTKRVVLLILFLIGIIHSGSFGQGSNALAMLNQAAHCVVVVDEWMSNQRPSETKLICAFPVSTVDTNIITPDFVIYSRVDKSLIISVYASPEIPSAYDRQLSERRASYCFGAY